MPHTGSRPEHRAALLSELSVALRHCTAAYALLNQAIADRFALHPTDVECLNLLSLEADRVTISRVGELTGLSTGAATRLVDRLERAGYATRERDTADRRRVLVATVPERMAVFAQVWQELGGAWWQLFDDYDDDHLILLLGYLRRTVRLSAAQVTRLRSGARDAPPAPAS